VRVSIDQAACQGDCICSIICPDVFVLDETGIAWPAEDGVPVTPGGPECFATVPPHFEDDVEDAAGQCPTSCIRVRT
jgi:ferredoxin